MGRNVIETIMGAVVLAVAAFFLIFAYSQADLGAVKGYDISSSFASVGGLPNGADVRINGIKVGSVAGQKIDPNTFNAVVEMSISPKVHLPVDTVAMIDSEGLLGDKFVKLEPGRSAQTIAPGGTIAKTKNYKSLEEMVGQIIFLATDNTGGKPAGQAPANGQAPASPAANPSSANLPDLSPLPTPAPAPGAPGEAKDK